MCLHRLYFVVLSNEAAVAPVTAAVNVATDCWGSSFSANRIDPRKSTGLGKYYPCLPSSKMWGQGGLAGVEILRLPKSRRYTNQGWGGESRVASPLLLLLLALAVRRTNKRVKGIEKRIGQTRRRGVGEGRLANNPPVQSV